MPAVRFPLVGSFTARGWAKSLGTSAKDQQYINALTEVSANPQMGSKSVYCSKRAGSATGTTITSDIVITKHYSSYFSTQFVASSSAFYTTAGTNLGTLTAPITEANNYVLADSVPSANTNIGILAWVTEDGEGWYLYSDAITTNFPTFTGDTHTNTTIDNITSTTGLYVGQAISGTNIVAGTRIATVASATSITTTIATTGTTAGVTITKEAISLIIDTDFPTLSLLDGADFDGSNDYMTRGAGLTGAADSKKGIFSAWIRIDGGDSSTMHIFDGVTTVGGSSVRVSVFRHSSNVLFVQCFNSSSTLRMSLQTTGTYLQSAQWLNILASWDVASSKGFLYINDVSDLGATLLTDDTLDYTLADWSVGADAGGNTKLNGCLAEVYFAPGQYLDFSIVANRRKFISANVEAVNLGDTGALPTGTAPLVYQHLDSGEAVANFATNRGTGGNFTITGTLATSSTTPAQPSGGGVSMAALDGRFFVVTGGALVYQSGLNDPSSWASGEFVAADYNGDGASFIYRHGRYIVVAGSLNTIQYFYNAGNPFGSVLSKTDDLLVTGLQLHSQPIDLLGTKYCIAFSGGSESPGGQPGLYTLSGANTFTKVSDDVTSSLLNSVTRIGTAYNSDKSLLVLHSESDSTFITYDPSSNQFQPFSLSAAITSANGTYFTKSGSSTLFTWAADNTWTDSTAAYTMTLQTELWDGGTMKNKTINSVTLIADNEASGTTSISWSDDDYASFSTARTVDMTTILKRLDACGTTRRRAFKVEHSANTGFRGQALEIDFTVNAA